MLLQQLISGCERCHTRRLLQYIKCQQYNLVQDRQLMNYTRVLLFRCNIQGRQVEHVKQLVRRVAAHQPANRALMFTGKSRTTLLFPSIKGSFQRPVRFHQSDSKGIQTEEEKKYEQFVEQLKKKQEKSTFKDGINAPQAVIIVVIFFLIYSIFKPRENVEKPKVANKWKVTLYRKMPLKSVSRVWGKMTCWELPMTLREPLLGLYCWMFGVQLHEAEDDNLKNYNSLNELFRRKLKPNVRIVDHAAPVTSPADGRILHFGKVEDGVVEQVKGVNYTVQGFLGPQPGDEEKTKPIKDTEYQAKMKIKEGYDLYNCIIYLAPGDYHRFHSASDWKIHHRRHFPGELLSVNPSIARWVQGLFNMNERAVYSGTWEHGYFSYTAVGATNVGSIKIYFDENLETNIGASHPNHVYHDRSFGNPDTPENINLKKGEMVGEFNLGSTVVLLFEAPSNFEFDVKPGQKVKVGERLGGFSELG
ncbi:phosphatidylserine decarboxylase proenzyme, mitochondrial-like isoform X1 [Mercenaria mercenaria]|uniref:phosphatidylserine decarboxylase proenzyme, mitochondrial-like isoform X1 n=1 Tax=Mercenaria mercenaria TaxID=6596 RepID=UPI00234E9C68|nr:phosphatidylserine decarboxylase proenzyme, mitochondrial-like isoform X1 [Mercenaria mercenaria]XP_045172541.2 phosphatidylserine decarboxylase proenzyme, mitochondrial-like isoform X1 [Mercenaria mercenaria]